MFDIFFFILVLSILEIIMQKNKSENKILSAWKTAATLIIATTLNIVPTVYIPVTVHFFLLEIKHCGINCVHWWSVHFNKDPPHIPNG